MVALLTHSIGRHAPDAVRRRQRFAAVLRVYDPLAIAVLGIMVISGATALTPYKQSLGRGFFGELGYSMAGKLGLAFVLILMATYVCFGLCHRLVRADEAGLPITDAALDGFLIRLRTGLWLTIAVALYTLWFALGLDIQSHVT